MRHVNRFVYEHRRLLAAAFAGLAVFAALTAVRHEPDHLDVVVAARDLPSGRVIGADDVTHVAVPSEAAPRAARTTIGQVIGRRVAGPMRRGEVVTDMRVLDRDHLRGHRPGDVMTSVRIDDTHGLVGLRIGDRIDIVAVDPDSSEQPHVIARDTVVVMVPPLPDGADVSAVSIATTEQAALRLAAAAVDARFSIITTS